MMNNKRMMPLLLGAAALTMTITSQAGSPVWTFIPLTPTTISVPSNSTATVQYRVTNQSPAPHTLMMVPMTGITQTTTAGNCSNPFTLSSGNPSCTLTLLVTGSALNADINGGPKVCQQGADGNPSPLECYQPSQNNSLNITRGNPLIFYGANSSNNTISTCQVNNDGELANCTVQSDSSFQLPQDIILNQQANIAYIMNAGTNEISLCSIHENGGLGSCSTAESATFNLRYGGLYINNGFLYATNYPNDTISICPINSDGSLGTCLTSNGNHTLNGPNGRSGFNPSGTIIYIGNYNNNTVSICPINMGGSLGECIVSNGNETFSGPVGVAVSSTGTTLYVANSSNTISICPIKTDGTLDTCIVSTGNGTFSNDGNDANMFMANQRFGYIPNVGNNTISICPFISNDIFGTCVVSSDLSFNGILSAWLG